MEEREEIALDTINVSNNQFYSHYPRRISKGTVDAEQVKIQLDKEWDGLTVRIHWLNVTSKVEKKPLLERDKPNTIPWEVLADLGELHMGLVGLDGNTVIKPTIWLTYGYVADGVDPEAGSDPQPPTPSWEQQMVEQATQAKQAAQAAQEAAEDAAESAASAGPYAEEAKKSAEAAKASQEATATSAQQASQAAKDAQAAAGSIGNAVEQAQSAATAAGSAQRAAETAQTAAAQSAGTAQGAATTAIQAAQTAQGAATQAGQYLASVEEATNAASAAATAAGKSQEAAQGAAQTAANARDQATTAATTAQGHATAAGTAKAAAEQAAGNAANAQASAAQSAQEAAGSASAAQSSQQAAEAAAAVLPKPTQEDAGKIPMVNPEGNGYIFGEVSGGGAGGGILLANYIHQGNPEYMIDSFDYETSIAQCATPHGLTEPTKVLIAPNDWETQQYDAYAKYIPEEWVVYTGSIYLVPVTETSFLVAGNDKETPIIINKESQNNSTMDVTQLHFESPINWEINNLDKKVKTSRICLKISGFTMPDINRYTQVNVAPGVMAYVAIWGVPKAVNSRHMLFNSISLDVDTNRQGVGFASGTSVSEGRRPNYAFGFWEKTAETLNLNLHVSKVDSSRYITQVRNYPGYAMWSNGTLIRIYATGVFE